MGDEDNSHHKKGSCMPKIKSHRGMAKRFKVTKGGKVKRGSAGRGHLLGHKKSNRKRKLRRGATAVKTDANNIKKLLPYS